MPTLGLTVWARAASLLSSVERGLSCQRPEQYRGVQPQSAPRESSLGKPDVSIQREAGKQEAGLACHTLARPERHREESSAHKEAARGEARDVALRLGRVLRRYLKYTSSRIRCAASSDRSELFHIELSRAGVGACHRLANGRVFLGRRGRLLLDLLLGVGLLRSCRFRCSLYRLFLCRVCLLLLRRLSSSQFFRRHLRLVSVV
eukprot:scaffold27076_cov67-Phaeocystis_antarctica.AAC.3